MTPPLTRVRVLVLQHGLGALDYRVPPGLALQPGDIVRVPLGPREILGVVWEADRLPAKEVPVEKLRPVHGRYDAARIEAPLRRLIEWVADYYLAPPSAVLRMAISSPSALDGAREITEYRPTGTLPAKLTPQRLQAIEKLERRQGLVIELARHAEVSDAVIRGLVKAGAIEAIRVPADRPIPAPDPDFIVPVLEEGQQAAANALIEAVKVGAFAPYLLDGVTGSGKTEVYFEAVAEALRRGGQVLVLVPEIALTEPWLRRFEARFGCAPVAWHSDLRSTERRQAWRATANGEARVVVGARSALFLPYRDLRLVVVDEAHEPSFKQEEGVSYHARDVAVVRAQFEACPVVLATATPAIETRVQAERGRYVRLTLPQRYGGAQMPAIETIDLRKAPPPRGRWISPPLLAELEATLNRGDQALLFLNRRGYAPLTLCRACGERVDCPNCTAWLVEHRLTRRLQCHHCGFVTPPPKACPSCGEEDKLVPCGPGVERVAEEVAQVLPQARVAIVTSDTIWSPARAAALIRGVESGEINLLIGTQLVTKGYHFPNLTLVGVIDADLGLSGGDLRAAERTYQQIAQVAGRAGRGAKPGWVYLQTHQPEAAVIRALVEGDTEGFYTAETAARREHAMPPFGRLAGIVVSGPHEGEVIETARALGRVAPDLDGIGVLGPAPAPLAMLRGRHRHRLLVHARRSADIQGMLRDWLATVPVPSSVRVTVDVDPYSFL
ncbi:primosomal protein N' [Sphingoaurantiacus capsulatus]|uniref:Replication restart protein PriA n=1 Tax=Sphingoaurantiacus capsulatus TaxID=1771310 RepID=A0ABV7XDQ3_9SPHN